MTDLTVRLVLNADGKPLRAEIGGAGRELDQLAKRMEDAGVRVTRTAAQAETALAQVGAAAAQAGSQVDAALAGRATPALARLKANVGQIGSQVGDFVTQVHSGGDAFTAFAQQGVQLAGALAGGLAGLAVQLGAVVAQMVANSDLFRSSTPEVLRFGDAQETLRRALEGAAVILETAEERTRRLTIEQRKNAAGALEQARTQIEARRAIAEATATGLEAEVKRMRERLGDADFDFQLFRDGAFRQIEEARGELRLYDEQLRAIAENERRLFNAPLPSGRRARDTTIADPFKALREDARRLELELRTPLERYSDEVERLNTLFNLGLSNGGISAETYARGLERAGQALAKAEASAREANTEVSGLERAFETLGEQVQGFGRESAKALADALVGLRALDGGVLELVQRLGSGVLEKLIYEQITGPLTQAAAALLRLGFQSLGGLFGLGGGPSPGASAGPPIVPVTRTPLFHAGGVAGREATFLRAVPEGLFAGAPRFHAGGYIKPGEVPAILRAGEGVFTPEQMRALGPGGGVTVNVIDQRGGGAPIEARERRGDDGRRVIDLIVRDAVNRGIADGSFDRSMGMAYGLSRAGMR